MKKLNQMQLKQVNAGSFSWAQYVINTASSSYNGG